MKEPTIVNHAQRRETLHQSDASQKPNNEPVILGQTAPKQEQVAQQHAESAKQ